MNTKTKYVGLKLEGQRETGEYIAGSALIHELEAPQLQRLLADLRSLEEAARYHLLLITPWQPKPAAPPLYPPDTQVTKVKTGQSGTGSGNGQGRSEFIPEIVVAARRKSGVPKNLMPNKTGTDPQKRLYAECLRIKRKFDLMVMGMEE